MEERSEPKKAQPTNTKIYEGPQRTTVDCGKLGHRNDSDVF